MFLHPTGQPQCRRGTSCFVGAKSTEIRRKQAHRQRMRSMSSASALSLYEVNADYGVRRWCWWIFREERDIFRGSLKKLTLKTDLIKSPKTATKTLTVYGWHTQLQQWQLSAHISDANDWMAVEMWHVCSLEEEGEVTCLKLKADRRLLSLKTISWLQGHENGRLWGHQSVRVKRWWESTE